MSVASNENAKVNAIHPIATYQLKNDDIRTWNDVVRLTSHIIRPYPSGKPSKQPNSVMTMFSTNTMAAVSLGLYPSTMSVAISLVRSFRFVAVML